MKQNESYAAQLLHIRFTFVIKILQIEDIFVLLVA